MKDTFHQFDMILRPWSFTSLEQHLEFFDTGIVVEQLDSRKKIIESYRMIYFGIVLNGSIVSRFILERGSVFKFCVCVCALATNMLICIGNHCIDPPLGLSSLHILKEVVFFPQSQVSKLLGPKNELKSIGFGVTLRIPIFSSKFLKYTVSDGFLFLGCLI